ncbi:U4/U6.U5 tri-snRNP component SNU23, partial [Lecanoromycetidae sp. Uapishka_2]
MSAPSKSNAGDTSFRKTWDRVEYTAKAEAREAKYKEEGAARAEAKLSGQKYRPRASTPPDAKDTESRAARLDVSQNVGKISLVPAGAATGKRGRSAGFYCADCDLTFKDNLQFVEHLNSRQHQIAIGQSGEVKRATLEEVKERLDWLVRKKREEKEGVGNVVDLGKRLEVRKEVEEREREEKRRKRNEKRRKTKDGSGIKVEEDEGYGGGIIS